MLHDSQPNPFDFDRLEGVIRRDPGGRGLASFRGEDGRGLLFGELAEAAKSLIDRADRVAIVCGFAILTDDGPVAETDGPPGAIFLAAMLQACGRRPTLVTDELAAPLLRAGLQAMQTDDATLCDLPLLVAPPTVSDESGRAAVRNWWRATTEQHGTWSHLVAVERVGPSRTGPCFNMRGLSLDDCTAPLDLLFDDAPMLSDATTSSRPSTIARPTTIGRPITIGIVDGGNEIGCGKIPIAVLQAAVARGNGGSIACRTTTDRTIVAGISNWGAYGLAAAVAAGCGKQGALRDWNAARQRALIEAIVQSGGAVDGVTKRREPTVDGVALDDYLATFDEIRRVALG